MRVLLFLLPLREFGLVRVLSCVQPSSAPAGGSVAKVASRDLRLGRPGMGASSGSW